MKTLLAPIHEAVAQGFDTMLIGNTITVKIDSDRRVEIRFYDTKTHQCYDSLSLTVTSKTHGIINNQLVHFSSIFTSMIDTTHVNRLRKHIWVYNGKTEWYGKPTIQDINALIDTVVNYINLWE